jgi:hypothetical protein
MALSKDTLKILRAKDKKYKSVTLSQLKKVYARGQGAFLSSGSRPKVSMSAWAMARVNSFIKGSRKHDTDLRRKKKK